MLEVIVFLKEGSQSPVELWHCLIRFDVYVIVLDSSPQPLDHHIVKSPPFAIHAYFHFVISEDLGESIAGELAALISIEDLGSGLLSQSILETIDAKGSV